MSSESVPPFVRISLELRGHNPVLKSLTFDFFNLIGQKADKLDYPKLTQLPQAIAVILIRYKAAKATSRFSVHLKNGGDISMLRLIKTAKNSSTAQMGPLRSLANGNFLRLFKTPGGKKNWRQIIELDLDNLKFSDVSITYNGSPVEPEELEKLADRIAQTWGWKTSDYMFEADGNGTTQLVREVGQQSPVTKLLNEPPANLLAVESVGRPQQSDHHQLEQSYKIAKLNYKLRLLAAYAGQAGEGYPSTIGTTNNSSPSLISDIFVKPFCSEQRVSPAQIEEAEKNDGQLPCEDLLSKIEEGFTGSGRRRLVILGDPGMGKSTLIRWLIISPVLEDRTNGAVTEIRPLPSCLTEAIPLPFFVRDLVRYLPENPEEWNWGHLTRAFRKVHVPNTATTPLLSDFNLTFDLLLEDENALFLIDGLDEIGSPLKREKISAAIIKGFDSLPKARFLIASRIVGYADACVHERTVDTVKLVHPENKYKFASRKEAEGYDHEWERVELEEGEAPIKETLAQVLYLTPFTKPQQDEYARLWFKALIGPDQGPTMASAFMGEARRKESIRVLSRVPHLLAMMASVKIREPEVPLPDGRAKLLAAFSKAYLESIQDDRGIITDRHGHALPCGRKEAEKWLAVIAMHMHVRLAGQYDNSEKEAQSDKPRSKEGREILAKFGDIRDWLEPVIKADKPNESADVILHKFLNFISSRTPFLLARGDDQYGFDHLTYLEYYTARWLNLEFHRLINQPQAGKWLHPDLKQSWPLLERYTSDDFWREPLHFLAEILSKGAYQFPNLLQRLFPWFKDRPQVLPTDKRPAVESARLLITLSLDTKMDLSLSERRKVWTYLWRQWLNDQPRDVIKWHTWKIEDSLLDISHFQQDVIQCLYPLLKSQPGVLRLSGCSALRNLAFLKGAGKINGLSLTHCSSVTSESLEVFKHLEQLTSLRIHRCAGVGALSAVSHLRKLTQLIITGCPGVNDLTGLQDLSQLKELDLGECAGVTDLRAIQGLRGLKSLDLRACTGLTDLSPLTSLRSLRTLIIKDCEGLHSLNRQVKRLNEALPTLTIHR